MIDEETKKWLIKAMNDYKTAKQLINAKEEDMVTDSVCFHCQQFVEKSLKSYLVFNNIEFEKVHNLEYLIKFCTEKDNSFQWLFDVAKQLSQYAVEIRYPDEFYIPTIKETKECFQTATKIKDFILQKLRVTEDELK
jgi:HEPN domain-containing protein